MEDFKEWFREHEEQKYQHSVNDCLNPNNCTLNYIKEMIFDYCNERECPNRTRSQLVSDMEKKSKDFSTITNTIWEKSYKEMQENVNKTLGYENNPQLVTTYMRMLNHKIPQEEVQKMLKNNVVQREWAPLLNKELDYMEKNGQIEKLFIGNEKDIVAAKTETGLIRFRNNAVFQFMKAYDKSENFQAAFLHEQTNGSTIPDLFESIKTSQENFSISMDVKNEENKHLVTRCSELEDSLESMEDDILDLKDRLESQIERNQDLKEQLDIVLELTENPIKDMPNNDKINTLSGPVLEDAPFGLDEI